MAQGLTFEQANNPEFLFAQAEPFVQTFGAHVGAEHLRPMDRPMEYAEFVLRHLQPRNPSSVFNQERELSHEERLRPSEEGGMVDRYADADKSLPEWVQPHIGIIHDAAHNLGIRDKELGTTMEYPFQPGLEVDLAVALEGANDQDYLRAAAIAEELRAGNLRVERMVVAVTDRNVGEKEAYGGKDAIPGLKVGHGVGALAVARLYSDYSDVFGGANGVPLSTFNVTTHFADTRQTMAEAAAALGPRDVLMSGSNIYGSWMSTDLATTRHLFPRIKSAHFAAGPDAAKAARTDRVWTAEIAQGQVSAAHLRYAQLTKKR